MSSGYSGGVSEFSGAGSGGINAGRSTMMPMNTNNPQSQLQFPQRSPFSGMIPDPASQIFHQRPNLVGKRSLTDYQQHQQLQFLQNQGFGINQLRNVKSRNYDSPLNFSALSSDSNFSTMNMNVNMNNPRHGLPIVQKFRSQPVGGGYFPTQNPNFSSEASFVNQVQVQNRAVMGQELLYQESEKKMMNRLLELEKQLLDDNDVDEGDIVSVVTNDWSSETIQNLISPSPDPNKDPKLVVSLSPTSSSSSCATSVESPAITWPKQSMMEAATAISDGKNDVASEILTRLLQVVSVNGSSEHRLLAYMASALRSRVNPTEYPPPVMELYSKEHTISTQNLYEVSPCFKLGFMAANLAILEAVSDKPLNKLHVVDFDIGQGGQYLHLLHALAAAKKPDKPATIVKITAVTEFAVDIDERLKSIELELKGLATKIGVCLSFNVIACKISDLSREKLGIEPDESLAVNLAFKLYKLPDESVTTENLRDELLRRVKSLSPAVVTVVEQELNGNTASFSARVNEASAYYGALLDSLDATVSRDNSDRVKIEEGLSRKIANSLACEGRERVERCEVLGKWRARMSMAGFGPRPMSQLVVDSLSSKLKSGTRGNPGFTVNEQSGGICFGWMGRTLTVASAWR